MEQKHWHRIAVHLLLFLSLLLAAGQPSLAYASTSAQVGTLPEPADASHSAQAGPAVIETLHFTAITAGAAHTCGLVSTGGVKCWGENGLGELGDGTTTDRSTPVDVAGLTSGVTAITAGAAHTCALVAGSGVECWGWNERGQLGDGTNSWQSSTPVNVVGLASGVTAITAGAQHTCALVAGSGVKCWGDNDGYQLGDGDVEWYSTTPVNVVGLASGVTAIAAGGGHTCALVAGGGIKCWGWNGNGQLGDGTTTPRNTPRSVVGLASSITAITAGGEHTCALAAGGGGVKCWGGNRVGQLGDGTTTDRSKPVDVVGLASGVTAITAGLEHTCALTAGGGGVKCWGGNWSGEIGDGTTTDRSKPVDVVGLASGATAIAAGGSHTCALVAGGGVKCWGYNEFGQLGDGTWTDRSTPVDVVLLYTNFVYMPVLKLER